MNQTYANTQMNTYDSAKAKVIITVVALKSYKGGCNIIKVDHSSGGMWKWRWSSWAPGGRPGLQVVVQGSPSPASLVVSVHVKQHFALLLLNVHGGEMAY